MSEYFSFLEVYLHRIMIISILVKWLPINFDWMSFKSINFENFQRATKWVFFFPVNSVEVKLQLRRHVVEIRIEFC